MSNLTGHCIACIDCEHCKKDDSNYRCGIGVVRPYIGDPFESYYCSLVRAEWPRGTQPIIFW